MSYFVIRENYWGFHESDIVEAVKNCGIHCESPVEILAENISGVSSQKELDGCFNYMKEEPWPFTEYEFWVSIIPEGWKLDKVNPIDGNQSWVWEGEGDKPEFKPPKLHLRITDKGKIVKA